MHSLMFLPIDLYREGINARVESKTFTDKFGALTIYMDMPKESKKYTELDLTLQEYVEFLKSYIPTKYILSEAEQKNIVIRYKIIK